MRMQMLRKHIQKINYSLQKASLNKVHKVTESLGRPDNFIPPNGLVPKSYVCIWKQKMLGD
jgi:transposase